MVLPLLFSLGLPALASTGALGATLAGFGVPALAGLGAGLGSFLQTGDIGKGIQTGLMSFVGGKVLGGLTNSTSPQAINASQANVAAAPKPGFIDSIIKPSPSVADIAKGTSSNLANTLFGEAAAQSPAPFINEAYAPGATKGGAFTAGQQAFTPALMGQSMTDAQLMEEQARKAQEEREANKITPPMPNPMRRSYNPTPYYNNAGTGSYINYQRLPRADGSVPEYPYNYARGGIISLAEGGEVEQPDAMREDQLILNSIRAVKGELSMDRAQAVLGEFLEEYGEEALKDLIEKTKSGAYDETADRFARGEKGIVRGPGDGSGEDDKVPATLEGTNPVLLTEDEFVIRQPTQEALTKAFGGGFLDKVNQAEEAAPEVLKKMVG
jgi:hypothetical protein